MAQILHHCKPAASRKTHLLLAALFWSGIGMYLLIRSEVWSQPAGLAMSLLSMILGFAKSYLILDRSALTIARRNIEMDDGRCLGAVYSGKTWLAVLGMVLAGFILRRLHLPATVLGVLYAMVGCGLLFSSRHLWRQWQLLHFAGMNASE